MDAKRERVKRTVVIAAMLAPLCCLLATSCDLTSLAGSDPQYIASYAVTSASNPELPTNETAIISGRGVYLTLPYRFAVAGVAVNPTVKLENGARAITPEGPYVAKDGMALAVTAGGGRYTYTLHVGVDPATIALPPLIASFTVTAARNSVLSSDAHGVIYADGVYLTLPYSVVTEEIPLTPTVTVAPGYSLSPTGTYPLRDGETLELTNTATSELSEYTLHVAADPATSPPLPPLESFRFLTGDNAGLSADADGVIEGTDIYVTLPYAAIETQIPMTPTVVLQSGYTITPSGSYVPQDGETLLVVNANTSGTTAYTLHVAVATSTIP